jgi:Tol biopolymer transport system component
VFPRDVGGGEFHQLYRYDFQDGKVTLLTDGKSRNTGARWARSGQQLAYASTRRTGKDTDIYVVDPRDAGSDRLLLERSGGGWWVSDWSDDEKSLLLTEYISANESKVHLLDLPTKETRLLTPVEGKVTHLGAQLAAAGRASFCVSDLGAEFQQLVQIPLDGGARRVLTARIPWDVGEFELSPDGRTIALISNEDGIGVLRLLKVESGEEVPQPRLPAGVPREISWHENGRDLGFTLESARSPSDAYSLDVGSGEVTRWTESETGGLNTSRFAEPKIVRFPSFDDRQISAVVYPRTR